MTNRLSRFIVCIFMIIAWSFVLSACHSSTIYYVAPSGSDLNPGTQSKPWKTIQKAAAAMTAGDTVLIHAGTYNEKVVPANSGVEGNYITYKNFGDGEVIIDAQGGARSSCIEVNGKAYLQFIGLHLKSAGYNDLNAAFKAFAGSNHLVLDKITAENSRYGIMLKGNRTASESSANVVSFVTIKNSTIRNNSAQGIFLYYKVVDSTIGPNNVIYNENEKNDVPVEDQHGINLDTDYPGNPANGPRRITIIGNEIYGNRIQGIRPWNAQDLLIKDNYIHHNGATGIQIEDGSANVIVDGNRSEFNSQSHEYETGIWIDSSVNAVVQNNIVRGNQIGLMVTSTDRVLIRNNVIYDNNRAPTGSNIMGVVLNRDSTHITFVHNTVWRNGAPGSRGNLAYCIKPTTDTVIINNIFSESLGDYDSWLNCAVVSDFNNIYNNRKTSMKWMGRNLNWSQYLSASDQDRHSVTGDPLFVDAMASNFSLSKNSPDIDGGSPLTQTANAGSGTAVKVGDARYFADGYGLIAGDSVRIGAVTAVITHVDYAANIITIDRSIRWNKGDSVSYLYAGTKPDLGAMEMGVVDPAPTLTPTSGASK